MSNSGDLSRWYVGKSAEAAIDTAATLNASFYGTFDIDPKHDKQVDKNVNGTPYEQRTTVTRLRSPGQITADITANLAAFLVKFGLHAKPTTTGAGDPYTHTWTDEAVAGVGGIGTAGISFTATHQIAAIATYIDKFTGLSIPSFTISQSGDGLPQISAPVEGSGTVATTTEPSVAFPTEGYFISAKSTLSVGGSDVSNRVASCSMTVNSGFTYIPRVGSTTGAGVSIDRDNKRPFIEFTYELNEGAVNESGGHDDWPAKTRRAIIWVLKGDSNRDITITLAKCELMDGYPIKQNKSGVYTVQRKVRAFYDATATPKWFTIAVRNDVASYT